MPWLSPEELVTRGFERSRVVMMNEGHNGRLRCPRTRRIGTRVLPAAHAAGCRYLAMEAIWQYQTGPSFRTAFDREGYLQHPELGALAEAALALGWQLVGYEQYLVVDADDPNPSFRGVQFANRREREQAENLIAAFGQITDRMLVWCGNSHHRKVARGEWIPMGVRFAELGGHAFCIDQLVTVSLDTSDVPREALTPELRAILDALGGTAGFLRDAPPDGFSTDDWDAVILSTDNAIE